MIKKLIIFLLFIVITLIAINFVTIPGFSFATQMKMGEKAVELNAATAATVIDIPLVKAIVGAPIQAVIVHDASAGYIELLQGDQCYTAADALANGATYVQGYVILFWLFLLLMIILLPRKHGKKKIKKLARDVAYDVVDEEIDNMAPPARSYAPAPRRREPAPRGGEGNPRRKQQDDYEDEDYDY